MSGSYKGYKIETERDYYIIRDCIEPYKVIKGGYMATDIAKKMGENAINKLKEAFDFEEKRGRIK